MPSSETQETVRFTQVSLIVRPCWACGTSYINQGLHTPHIYHQKRYADEHNGSQSFYAYFLCEGNPPQ